jgi:hypothetical protein
MRIGDEGGPANATGGIARSALARSAVVSQTETVGVEDAGTTEGPWRAGGA